MYCVFLVAVIQTQNDPHSVETQEEAFPLGNEREMNPQCSCTYNLQAKLEVLVNWIELMRAREEQGKLLPRIL